MFHRTEKLSVNLKNYFLENKQVQMIEMIDVTKIILIKFMSAIKYGNDKLLGLQLCRKFHLFLCI